LRITIVRIWDFLASRYLDSFLFGGYFPFWLIIFIIYPLTRFSLFGFFDYFVNLWVGFIKYCISVGDRSILIISIELDMTRLDIPVVDFVG
jgi:hypothetical protein